METLVGIALLKADAYLIMKIVHVLISIDLLPKHTEVTSQPKYNWMCIILSEDSKFLGKMKTRSFWDLTLIVWVVREKKFDSGQRKTTANDKYSESSSLLHSNSTISKSKIVNADQSKVDWKKS